MMWMLFVVAVSLLSPQNQQPAQSPTEVKIAAAFEAAVPVLFKEWTALRPQALQAVGLGQMMSCPGLPASKYFVFITCEDIQPPKLASIDVRKTDSILNPFIGIIRVETLEQCEVKRTVPSKTSWAGKKLAAVQGSCAGKTYAECLRAGAIPAPALLGSACTGGPGFSFPFQGDLTLSYRWTHGKWEFEKEEGAKPAPPSTAMKTSITHALEESGC